MFNLPMNFNFTFTDKQIGALACKADVIKLISKINSIDCGDVDDSQIHEILLNHRTKFINDIVNALGNLSDYQKGYISTLLERVEMSNSGNDDYYQRWQPCLVTGEWQ
jgi:hypothetical protein